MISPQPKEKIFLILENTNIYNKIKISELKHSLFLLPFERKVLQLKLSRLFPWTPPYFYRFKIRAEGNLLIKFGIVKKNTSQPDTSKNLHDPFRTYIAQTIEKKEGLSGPFESKKFADIFKEIYHYDYGFLKNLISKSVPIGFIARVDATTDFYKKKQRKDFCLFCKEPVLLEKGTYICDIDVKLCIKGKGKIILKVIKPSKVLKKVVITKDNLNKLSSSYKCSYVYPIQLPFKVESLSMVHLITEVEGDCDVEICKIRYKTDFRKCFVKVLKKKIVNYILHQKGKDFTNFLEKKVSLKDFSFIKSLEIADYLQKNGAVYAALLWYKSCLRKNPLCKICLEKMVKIFRNEGAVQQELHYKNILKNRFSTLVANGIGN